MGRNVGCGKGPGLDQDYGRRISTPKSVVMQLATTADTEIKTRLRHPRALVQIADDQISLTSGQAGDLE